MDTNLWDYVRDIFALVGYLTVGIACVMPLTDNNVLLGYIFELTYITNKRLGKFLAVMRAISIILWPITLPIMLIVMCVNYILIKKYKNKLKGLGQLKKIMVRKNKICNFYCELYKL